MKTWASFDFYCLYSLGSGTYYIFSYDKTGSSLFKHY
jgi:hypothetical protein